MTSVEIAIAAVGIPAEAVLLLAWVYGGRRRPFWAIGLYTAYHLSFSLSTRLLNLRRKELSSFHYYEDQAIDFILITCVVVENFLFTIAPLRTWKPYIKRNLVGGLVAGILSAAVLVKSLKFVGFTHSEMWDDRLDLLSSLVLCTFLLSAGQVIAQLGAPRSADAKAISRALSVWTGCTLLVDISHMNANWSRTLIFDQICDLLWSLMLLSWAYSLVRWTPHTRPVSTPLQEET